MVHFIPINNRKAGLIMVLAMLIIGFICLGIYATHVDKKRDGK